MIWPARRILRRNSCSLITDDWQKMVDAGYTTSPRYLRNNGLPCVFIWDFIAETMHKDNLKHSVRHIDAAQIRSFIDYFHKPGKYQAFLVSGGSWSWKKNFPLSGRSAQRFRRIYSLERGKLCEERQW